MKRRNDGLSRTLLTCLWAKKSAKGNFYLYGRNGNVDYCIVPYAGLKTGRNPDFLLFVSNRLPNNEPASNCEMDFDPDKVEEAGI